VTQAALIIKRPRRRALIMYYHWRLDEQTVRYDVTVVQCWANAK